MFLTDCTTCGKRELRGPRSIELLANTDHGIDLVFRCTRCESTVVVGASRHAQPVASAA
jgi:DNA-directed RNA polymerase subunit RPC12/RpoP